MTEKFFSRQNYLSNIYIHKKKVILVIERI